MISKEKKENEVKLTKLAQCSGCGAKVGAGVLQELLGDLKIKRDENILVGFDKSDDACVYKINDDTAIVQTVDFFPPVADDPYTFGQIAAANALSDVYAMGGTPKTALNILAVPKSLPKEHVHEILRGGYDKVYEAGASICGGHSIYDEEPKYGLCVTGIVHPDRYFENCGAKEGDVLLYTKPLGIGIMINASKADLTDDEQTRNVLEIMKTLNKTACECMLKYDVHACTDVTGFSMMGHSLEMAQGSNVRIVFDTGGIKYIDGVFEFAKMGFIPEGAYRNRKFAGDFVDTGDVPLYVQDVLFDPQTSGGLLISLPKEDAQKLIEDLKEKSIDASIIAHIEKYTEGKYIILK